MKIVEYTAVIIEQRTEGFLVRCGYCDGGGCVNGEPCDVCDGKGVVGLRIPPNWNCNIGMLKCSYCNGSGCVNGEPCDVCDGVGALVKCFPRLKCAYCDGGGCVNGEPCDVCGGCGSVWVGKLRAY